MTWTPGSVPNPFSNPSMEVLHMVILSVYKIPVTPPKNCNCDGCHSSRCVNVLSSPSMCNRRPSLLFEKATFPYVIQYLTGEACLKCAVVKSLDKNLKMILTLTALSVNLIGYCFSAFFIFLEIVYPI